MRGGYYTESARSSSGAALARREHISWLSGQSKARGGKKYPKLYQCDFVGGSKLASASSVKKASSGFDGLHSRARPSAQIRK